MLQTKYITLDEFQEYTGIDLREELGTEEQALAFLTRIEVRMEAFLNANFFKLISDYWPDFTDFQKLHYKYALLEQALYVFRNGEISVDSGYDPEKGIIIRPNEKKDLILAQNSKDHLMLIGLWNRHIRFPGFFSPVGEGGFWIL